MIPWPHDTARRGRGQLFGYTRVTRAATSSRMKIKWMLIVCTLAASASACGKKAAEQAGEKMARDFVVNGAKEDLPKIKAAIASAKPTDGMFECAATMANIDKLMAADK